MANKSVNCLFLALISIFFLGGCAPENGPSTFDECVLNEMKGRAIDQKFLVEDGCRKKFPVLKEFMNTSRLGTLTCTWQNGNQTPFEISIEKNKVSSYMGDFNVLFREDWRINSKSENYTLEGKWESGAILAINFVDGVGYIFNVKNEEDQFVFSCHSGSLQK